MAPVGLPPGEAIHTTAGRAYAFDAIVKTTHSKADLFALAAGHGLSIANYGEGPPQGGYRRVAALALATSSAILPWDAPWPLSIFDASHLLEATEEPHPDPAAVAAIEAARPTAATVPTSAIDADPQRAQGSGVGGALLVLGLGLAADLLTGEGPMARLARRVRRQAR